MSTNPYITAERVRCLVPDLGDDLLTAITRVEEMLMALDPGQPGEPDALPEPLAGGQVLEALHRVWTAVHPGQGEHAVAAGYGRLLAPDGDMVLPLRVVAFDSADLAILGDGGKLLLDLWDRGDYQVEDVAREWARDTYRVPGQEDPERLAAGELSRVHAVLAASSDQHEDPQTRSDTVLLNDRVAAGEPTSDATLTHEEHEAYRRLAVRTTKVWSGQALDLVLYGFYV